MLKSVGSELDEWCESCCVFSSGTGCVICIDILSHVETSDGVSTSEEKGFVFIAGQLFRKGLGSWRERVLDVGVVMQLWVVLSEKSLRSESLDWLVGFFVSVSIVVSADYNSTIFRIRGVLIPPSVPVVGVVVRAVVGSVGSGIVMLVVDYLEIGNCFFAGLVVILFFAGDVFLISGA